MANSFPFTDGANARVISTPHSQRAAAISLSEIEDVGYQTKRTQSEISLIPFDYLDPPNVVLADVSPASQMELSNNPNRSEDSLHKVRFYVGTFLAATQQSRYSCIVVNCHASM